MTTPIRRVSTQAELDAALGDDSLEEIIIESSDGVWLQLESSGSATVRAYDSATVRASGSATVSASGSATVRAYDSATVSASGSATVRAYDSATVSAYGSATVSASGSATVRAYDSATVSASGSATVSASGSATVRAYDSATVSAYGSATVSASGSATVRASGSATVSASGSATVRAYDSATVSAGTHVAVHLHSSRVRIEGGVVIDVTELDLKDTKTWLGYAGITPDADEPSQVTVYKAVDAGTWRSSHGFEYRPGQTVTDPRWRDDNDCGGGLHFGPTPAHADAYHFGGPARYLACRVFVKDLRPIPGGGTAKCKAPSCEVLHEVDIHGRRVQAVESAATAS